MGLGSWFKKKSISEEEKQLVKRAPRVQITALHGVEFKENQEGKNLQLVNLSITGVGFLRSSIENWPSSGSVVKGELVFSDRKVQVEAQIVHVSEEIVGCQFQGDLSLIREVVPRYFQLELSALKLVRVKRELLKDEEDGDPLWFRGSDNCELFLVEKGGDWVRFNLVFFGNHFEGTRAGKIQYGQVVEDEPDELQHKSSHLIRQVSSVSQEVIEGAVRFVQNISELPQSYRESLSECLSNAMK